MAKSFFDLRSFSQTAFPLEADWSLNLKKAMRMPDSESRFSTRGDALSV